jgi:uncharacterized membrane protein YbhN (UPF0104 family)
VIKRYIWWFKLGIALALIGYLLYRVGLVSLRETLIQADTGWLFAGGGAIFVGFLLNALSMQVLIRGTRRGRVGGFDYFAAFFHSSFLSFWLPGRIGDFSIAYMLKNQIPMGDTLVCTFLDKVITLVVMLIVALIGIDYFLDIPSPYWFALGILMAIGLAVVLVTHRWFLNLLRRYLSKKVKQQLDPLWDTFLHFVKYRRNALAVNIVITAIRLFVVGLSLVFMLRAFSETLPLIEGILAVGSVQVLSLFPISVQGLGVMEGAYMVLLSPKGISEAGILLLCFIGRVLSILIIFTIHLIFILLESIRREQSSLGRGKR